MKARLLLCFVLALVWSPGSRALDDTGLPKRINQLVAEASLPGTLGMHVVRLSDGKPLYERNATTLLNPASNLKLLTAAAALRRLGPDFHTWTGFYGEIQGGQVAELFVRGHGDPTLRVADLVEVAQDLWTTGVRRVSRIVIDGSYFDDEVLPPAFDQQPNEDSSFRAAIGPIAVERNAYVLAIRPGPSVGAPARVSVWADSHILIENKVTTIARGATRIRAEQVPTADRRLKVTVRGSMPIGRRIAEYRRRVEDPLSYAGHAIAKALSQTSIGGPKAIRYGQTPEAMKLLSAKRSAPLSQLLYSVGKWSDNFSAEMLVKVLGTEAGRPGSSASGLSVVIEELERLGLPLEGFTMVNGSGLFRGNKVAPAHLTRALVSMYGDPTLASEYVAHLAIAGADGTLRKRLTDLPVTGMVRAKTGTLSDVIALSGYVFGKASEDHLAFSLLFNGIKGRQKEARSLADDVVRELARAVRTDRQD